MEYVSQHRMEPGAFVQVGTVDAAPYKVMVMQEMSLEECKMFVLVPAFNSQDGTWARGQCGRAACKVWTVQFKKQTSIHIIN